MDDWMMWLILAGVVVALELFTGTFYLLMLGIGMLAGCVAALLGIGREWQIIIAGVVGAVASLMLHYSRFGYRSRKQIATRNPDVNLDIGQSIHVHAWHDQGNGSYTARAMYRGAEWDVELRQNAAAGGLFQIDEIIGNRLIVRPAHDAALAQGRA